MKTTKYTNSSKSSADYSQNSKKRTTSMCVWYKQVLNDRTDGIQNCTLTDGPMDLRIVIADKCLIVETDRPKVLFLERQCKSLA